MDGYILPLGNPVVYLDGIDHQRIVGKQAYIVPYKSLREYLYWYSFWYI